MLNRYFLAAVTVGCVFLTYPASAQDTNNSSLTEPGAAPTGQDGSDYELEPNPSGVSDVGEVADDLSVPIADREAAIYNQDDHLHTTPDKAFKLFEMLDSNSDRKLSYHELQNSDLKFSEKEFKKIDTDGSNHVDREEFVGIGPELPSNYE